MKARHGAVVGVLAAFLFLGRTVELGAQVMSQQDFRMTMPTTGMAANYVVAPGNVLRLAVSDRPDWAADYVVEEEGVVFLPALGAVEVAGLTVPQLRDSLRTAYSAALPGDVTITVTAYLTVPVIGAVGTPGNFVLAAGATPLQAVAAASGFRDDAQEDGIYILRGEERVELKALTAGGEVSELDAASANLALLGSRILQSGDAVIVPERALSWLTAGNLFTVAQLLISTVTLIKLF